MSITYLLNEAKAESNPEIQEIFKLTQNQIIKLIIEKLLSLDLQTQITEKQRQIIGDFLIRVSIATPNCIIELMNLLNEEVESPALTTGDREHHIH